MKIQIILFLMITLIHEHENTWAEMVKCTEEHIEKYGIIYGDEVQIHMKTDLIQIQQTSQRGSDHVTHDIMYQVDENGMNWLQHGVI